ncbi:hypothetical protein [Constantimarinum furrinae]|uniref:Glycerophosphoryl diester phosphodiesterase membrane domain-containing protein n=1 Tax=Constantimarinum furrinae TaxID=2562285 RepID=A0A7G8PVS3_9FLAO|nr:hypothetical protein [Constantimarinum furrinae]QNJ98439.1 hypothetical protein ALE3EI_1892 [Constantimarinum furrinae]
MKEKIQFRKQRELGTILTDLFKFLRLNGVQLFGLIFRIAGPALLVVVLSYVYYMQTVFGGMGGSGWMTSSSTGFGEGVGFLIALVLLLVSAMVYYALLYGTVLHSIKSYVENNGMIVKEEVTAGVRANFWSLLGMSILVGIMVFFGALFCLAPGIFLAVVLSLTYAIHVFEKRDVTDSISYSFSLIKGEWWITFATYLVLIIIYYILLMIFQVPQYIYFFVKGIAFAETVSADPSDMFDWVYMVLSSIGVIAQYLLQAIIVIATALIYYNLNEKKHFTGTMETIESIGNRED